MDVREMEAIIEAILFATGDAVDAASIAAATGQDEDFVRMVLQEMMARYESDDRGIQLVEFDGAYQLCTKVSMYEHLIKVVHVPKKHVLTEILLETLSIIAYKQPITKQEIEAIRGVKSDHAVNKLMEYNLVCEVGRMDAPGRPILFGTTQDFLKSFGISSICQLPQVDPERLAGFQVEAEAEILMP